MEAIHDEPLLSTYVTLSEYQSRTPQSFYSGPPVLHHRAQNARIHVYNSDLEGSELLSSLVSTPQTDGVTANGHSEGSEERPVIVSGIDIWVASDTFTLFRPSTKAGLRIPYPSISLHAIQTLSTTSSTSNAPASEQALYLQLSTSSSPFDEEDTSPTLSLIPSPASADNIVSPPATTPSTDSTTETPEQTTTTSSDHSPSPVNALFAAVSACANLHPDPVSPGSSEAGDLDYADGYNVEDGAESEQPTYDYQILGEQDGLPPPMPGSGGWITADNMDRFFDEEGNWKGEGQAPTLGLGPGAGSVRVREEEEGGGNTTGTGDSVAGDGPGGDETKWRRTG